MTGSVRSVGFTRLIAVGAVLIVVFALALALPVASYAAGTYHVSVIGNDSTADGSSALPFKTVQKAVDWAGGHGGGVVSVGIGVFSHDVTMTVSGVSLEGAGASLTVLRGDGLNSVIHLSNIAAGQRQEPLFGIEAALGRSGESQAGRVP